MVLACSAVLSWQQTGTSKRSMKTELVFSCRSFLIVWRTQREYSYLSVCAHFLKFHEPMCFFYSSFNSVLKVLFVSVFYQDLDTVHQMIGRFSSEQDHLVITLLSPNQVWT